MLTMCFSFTLAVELAQLSLKSLLEQHSFRDNYYNIVKSRSWLCRMSIV